MAAPTTSTTDEIALKIFSSNLNFKPNLKFTLKHARTIDNHTLNDDQLTYPNQIPEYIFNKLMIVDYNVRKFKLKPLNSKRVQDDNNYGSDNSEDEDEVLAVNPMDALLGVFHCSDDILRRYLASKLSACQLSVPFLLPDPKAPSENVSMLLSTLENITKSWKNSSNSIEGVQSVFATNYPFPVVSFIRIGEPNFSKSSLINKTMSKDEVDHVAFFHRDLEGGNTKRKVVDGLVELSWYLPGGSHKQILTHEICFANLRGDATAFEKQLNILLEISSVLCIILPSKCPNKKMIATLEKATFNDAQVTLIFDEKLTTDAKNYFSKLKERSDKKLSLITKAKRSNEYEFLQSIRENIQKNINRVVASPLVELATCVNDNGIQLEEDRLDSSFESSMHNWLKKGMKEAKNLLILQKHVPKLASLEREKYRPTNQGNKSAEQYADEIDRRIQVIMETQRGSLKELDKKVQNCFSFIVKVDRDKALIKLKHQLDKMSLAVTTKLHQAYRVAALDSQSNKEEQQKQLKQLEESITKCSFGLEHIFRELAQLYQIEESKYDYAGAAADMLLSGQPLEILDGDSFYIPLRWFDAVFTELDRKSNNGKIFVISVVGIQSSGKSTMLNTMFGLEFPVSAGRCTRGVFASVIPVSDSLKSASNFDYILVIDTEGLKGSTDPQLRKHDNELVTFAIGVADLTIVNIFGENHNTMKDFLEIAVHAFLKMKLVEENEARSCKIVHQNVAATDASDRLVGNRLNLRMGLDEMAKLVLMQENCGDRLKKFNDIIAFNENKDVFYLPPLLKGNPPMAPVNPEYGKEVQKIKEGIIDLMSKKGSSNHSVSRFRTRVVDLWTAILRENFIFSLRNILEVRARMSLDRKYFKESVGMMVTGMSELQVKIDAALKNCSTRNERKKKWSESHDLIVAKANSIREEMEKVMNHFIDNNQDKATLEQWREHEMTKIEKLEAIYVLEVIKNCTATFNHLERLQDVEDKKQTYEQELLKKAKKFVTSAQDIKNENKLIEKFDKKWNSWMDDIPKCQEEKINVNSEMVDVLLNTDASLTVKMKQKLEETRYLVTKFEESDIKTDDLIYSQSKIEKIMEGITGKQEEYCTCARKIKKNAIKKAIAFAEDSSKSTVRFSRNDLKQIFQIVVTCIRDEGTKNFPFEFNCDLQCDILIYSFSRVYEIFDEKESRHIHDRDIKKYMEEDLRPKLKKFFLNVSKNMANELLAVNSFAEVLEEKIESTLNWTMGSAVAKEIVGEKKFQGQDQFHARVLIQLGQAKMFKSYVPYLENPLEFLKEELRASVENHCLKEIFHTIHSLYRGQVNDISKDVLNAIETANNGNGNESMNLTSWIQQFVEKCSNFLFLKTTMFNVVTIVDLDNINLFQEKVRGNVIQLFATLKGREIEEIFRKWNPSPYSVLFSRMFPCHFSCPFCEALCDRTSANHAEHSTRSHRPMGIIGIKCLDTGKLSTLICTEGVTGEKKFRNAETNWAPVCYKDYKSVSCYKSWEIPPSSLRKSHRYWKWFMATFSKELAELHQAKSRIFFLWRFISFNSVKKELTKEYDL